MKRDVSEADTMPAGSRVGQVLAGKYRLERLLGRGGMGEVYEARHVVVGRRFAIKFLHAHLARGREPLARFTREAQAAGLLDSPHLAAVLDLDTADDGSPFLVMEFLTGASLATVLAREGRLPLRRAIAILLQACEGLEVAHRAGIVHRDLKPDNLFVCPQSSGRELIKILDFGIAKLLAPESGGDATVSGAVLGTPFYMAPEQARGERSVDLRVDVYALGVLAYELLSGEKPHPGDGYNAILAHILTQPIAPLGELCPELPRELVAVIERALAFDPAQRQASAKLLASELLPFAGREVAMIEAHFDLRPAELAPAGPATVAVTPASSPSTGGTLASAVGDVRSANAGSPRRRAPWLLGALAVATAFAFSRSRAGAPPEPREGAASAASSRPLPATEPTATPASPPPEPSASATDATSAETPPASSAPSTPPPARAKLKGSATKPTPAPSAAETQTPFDEKNPY